MKEISLEDKFLFDVQGFLLLEAVLSPEECATFLAVLERLETQTFEDEWMQNVKIDAPPLPTCDRSTTGTVRFNGLLRLDPVFDSLIDHPGTFPYLQEFMGEPQSVNTWSILKSRGADSGGWHHGLEPTNYNYRNGIIRSRMLNVVYFLTDNGPEDGCVVAIPGSHKNNIDLEWHKYKGLEMPGAVAVTGKAGDVFLFSETVIHNGLPKTTDGRRINLYYNYTMRDFNVMTYSPQHNHYFCMPPSIRARFTPQQKDATRWMEHCLADEQS